MTVAFTTQGVTLTRQHADQAATTCPEHHAPHPKGFGRSNTYVVDYADKLFSPPLFVSMMLAAAGKPGVKPPPAVDAWTFEALRRLEIPYYELGDEELTERGKGEAHTGRPVFTREVEHRIAARTEFRCWYCGASILRSFHVDHQLPRSREGSDAESNLVAACIPCNQRKHTKTVEEFRQTYEPGHQFFGETGKRGGR